MNSAVKFSVGQRVFKHFEILEIVGSGGKGDVYKARHMLLDRIVALKILKLGHVSNSDIRRFQHEAKVLSRLDHPNIERVFDFGMGEGNTPYLCMEFLEGTPMSEMLIGRSAISLEDFLFIFEQVADGLAHAHGRSIAHMDIKPDNIIIKAAIEPMDLPDESPSAVLVDFGIAKLLDSDTSGRLTAAGKFVGTPLYASPEQAAQGRGSLKSDMYSLGCVMFHALAGEPPFEGETAMETLRMHAQSDPHVKTRLSEDLPDEVVSIIETLLAKSPQDRYDSMNSVRIALKSLLEPTVSSELEEPNTPPVSERPIIEEVKSGSGRGIWVGLVGVSLVLLIGLTYVASKILSGEDTEEKRPLKLSSATIPVPVSEKVIDFLQDNQSLRDSFRTGENFYKSGQVSDGIDYFRKQLAVEEKSANVLTPYRKAIIYAHLFVGAKLMNDKSGQDRAWKKLLENCKDYYGFKSACNVFQNYSSYYCGSDMPRAIDFCKDAYALSTEGQDTPVESQLSMLWQIVSWTSQLKRYPESMQYCQYADKLVRDHHFPCSISYAGILMVEGQLTAVSVRKEDPGYRQTNLRALELVNRGLNCVEENAGNAKGDPFRIQGVEVQALIFRNLGDQEGAAKAAARLRRLVSAVNERKKKLELIRSKKNN